MTTTHTHTHNHSHSWHTPWLRQRELLLFFRTHPINHDRRWFMKSSPAYLVSAANASASNAQQTHQHHEHILYPGSLKCWQWRMTRSSEISANKTSFVRLCVCLVVCLFVSVEETPVGGRSSVSLLLLSYSQFGSALGGHFTHFSHSRLTNPSPCHGYSGSSGASMSRRREKTSAALCRPLVVYWSTAGVWGKTISFLYGTLLLIKIFFI